MNSIVKLEMLGAIEVRFRPLRPPKSLYLKQHIVLYLVAESLPSRVSPRVPRVTTDSTRVHGRLIDRGRLTRSLTPFARIAHSQYITQ